MREGKCTFTVKELASGPVVNVEMHEAVGEVVVDNARLMLIPRDGVTFEEVQALRTELASKILAVGIADK